MTVSASRQTLGWILPVVAVWSAFGLLRFEQGLDLSGQGQWVLGAALEARGDAVHSVIETGDGPLPYLVLAGWMRVFGESFLAAARLQAILHVALALLVGLRTLRHGTLALLLGQAGLFAAAPLPFAGLWAGLTLAGTSLLPARARPGLVFGVALAGLLTLDAAWFLFALACGALAYRTRARDLLAGFGGGLATVVVHALATGAVGSTLANALAGPWAHLADGGFARVFTTAISGAWLEIPFAGLATGEPPSPAWPGHVLLRAAGLRVLAAILLLSPVLIWWRTRDRTAIVLSAGAVLLVLFRGDVPGILAASSVSAVAWALADRPALRPLMIVFAVGLLPSVAENSWLVLRHDRAGLQRWESPAVGVLLHEARAEGLKDAIRELHLHGEQPALIWPDLAGLHFLLSSRPAVRDLAPGDDARSAEALRADPAPVVLLAPRIDLLPQQLERTHPRTAAELRRDYRLRGSLPAGGLNLRAFQRGGSDDDPLASRMPRVESIVSTGVESLSPALRNDLAIGQSFRIERDDLRGFAIRLVTSSDSVRVRLRARLWERVGSQYNSLLAAHTLELDARRDQPMHWFDFPVPDTAGRDLALVFETMETPAADVRFAWNEDAGLGDVYPGGSAMLDLDEVDADLVILIY